MGAKEGNAKGMLRPLVAFSPGVGKKELIRWSKKELIVEAREARFFDQRTLS